MGSGDVVELKTENRFVRRLVRSHPSGPPAGGAGGLRGGGIGPAFFHSGGAIAVQAGQCPDAGQRAVAPAAARIGRLQPLRN